MLAEEHGVDLGKAGIHPGAPEDDCTDPVDYNCDGSTGYARTWPDGFFRRGRATTSSSPEAPLPENPAAPADPAQS